tara:strand:+ start:2685 stop:3023 length:339 start_codon:yes stop_codon:yes gene_type:complete
MRALNTIEFMRSRTTSMPDAMLEMRLHRAIGAGAVRSNRPMALRAPQLSLCVASQSLIYGDGVPRPVGPQLAIFDHWTRMACVDGTAQVWKRLLVRSGRTQPDSTLALVLAV